MKRKTVIIFSLSFTAAFAVFLIVIFNHLAEEQIKKDKKFIDTEMKPAIIFVKDFYEKSGYCPAESDFRHTNLQCKGRIDIHISALSTSVLPQDIGLFKPVVKFQAAYGTVGVEHFSAD